MESQFPNDDGKGSTLCRQSSSRWTPTTEQIRILKDLYYNNGVKSPNADQIQKISAKLKQYGKIEGKNVFYWFQNHKAREMQKKRLTTDVVPMQRSGFCQESFYSCKYPNNITSGVPSSSTCAPGLVGNYPYGSLAMEKKFRDCSLSAGFDGGNCNNLSWGGTPDSVNNIIPQMPYPFLDHQYKRSGGSGEGGHYEQEEEHEVQEIETLPLFPMHGDEDGFSRCNKQQYCYPTNWYQYPTNGNMGCSRASLELTLNSYGTGWTNNNS